MQYGAAQHAGDVPFPDSDAGETPADPSTETRNAGTIRFGIQDPASFMTMCKVARSRVVLTSSGHLGLVGEAIKEGDVMTILFGVNYMKILRPVGDESFRIAGNAFLLDVSNNQGEDMLEVERDFIIC
jgi:hypothetical protein